MTIHQLQFGNRRISFEELDDVTAMREGRPNTRSGRLEAFSFRATRSEQFETSPVEISAAKAFEAAGWRFDLTRTESLRRIAARAERAGPAELRRVLRGPNGTLFLDSGHVTVEVPSDVTSAQAPGFIEEKGLVVLRRLPFGDGLYEARLPPGQPTLETLAELQETARFPSIEPEFLEPLGPRHRPPDPDYAEQWHWCNTGGNGGTQGADVNVEAAWDKTRGLRLDNGEPIRVAVIDNGFDLSHPKLSPALFKGGHFSDDGTGNWSFVARTSTGSSFPDKPHGTFCAGMVAARSSNTGGCGIAHEAAFMPIACFNDQIGSQATLATAIIYAAFPHRVDSTASASDGADVINCSLGPNFAPYTKRRVLDLAIQEVARRGRNGKGTPLVWAVSNGPYDIAFDEICSDDNVLSVGLSTRLDTYGGSAFGDGLDLLAPGVGVYSTTSGGGWDIDTGTSYAAPIVAGVAALLLAQKPDLTREEVVDRILRTCRKVGGVQYDANGRHPKYGHGRIDAGAAMF